MNASDPTLFPRQITLEARCYTAEELLTIPADGWGGGERQALLCFLKEWFSDGETIALQTSGSTAAPKQMVAKKRAMAESAYGTIRYFDLKRSEKALIPLSMEYIASKMMVVRAILAEMELHLIEPSGRPFAQCESAFDFVPMVPWQVSQSLQHTADTQRLRRVRNVLIGGASVPDALEQALQQEPNAYFASYGMTETYSHIALRRINGETKSSWFTPLPGYHVGSASEQRLTVTTPWCDQPLITNDSIVQRADGAFRLLGRLDDVVNSGGVKLHPDRLEQKVRHLFSEPFAFSSLPDPLLGERLVLVAEQPIDFPALLKSMEKLLSRHELPKSFIRHPIPFTSSGKIRRGALQKAIEERPI